MHFTALVYAHSAAFVAYALFALTLGVRGTRSWVTASYAVASAATAAWAGCVVLAQWAVLPAAAPAFMDTLLDGAWFAIILAILYVIGEDRRQWQLFAITTASIVAANAVFAAADLNAGSVLGLRIDARIMALTELGLGFFLLENLLRNLDQDRFWSVKLLGIGLGAVLLCQALVVIPEFLTNIPPAGIIVARPLVFLLAMPLFLVSAVRSRGIKLRVHSSRKIVFQTTALVATGIVLQGTAIAAYYLRTWGGDNGIVLAIIFSFGSAIGFAVALSSRSVRSRVIKFITENFFSYRYDYRLEWEKFIRTLSACQNDNVPLSALRTLTELLDSPGGALWVWRENWNRFMPVARWSVDEDLAPIASSDSAVQAFADEHCTFIDLTLPDQNAAGLIWRQRFPFAWLIVPLRFRGSLAGIALIIPPRSARKLHWEDKNLISLVSLQLAAYLVQQETTQALSDARQLEQFNKRFAFIIHDIKNATGQLSLLVRNAECYAHEEEFRRDMVLTLRNSVKKLETLLAGLASGALGDRQSFTPDRKDVAELASSFARDKRRLGCNVITAGGVSALAQLRDTGAFLSVLEHVVNNALEATGDSAPVCIGIADSGGFVRVMVKDSGPGMTEKFIADELFRPLKTTKRTGFGIGACQARQIMRDLGGDIEIHSKPGEGTTVSLLLPAAALEAVAS